MSIVSSTTDDFDYAYIGGLFSTIFAAGAGLASVFTGVGAAVT